MKLLIDTSGDEVRVLLARGDRVVAKRQWESGPDIGRRLLEVVDELLKENDIDLEDVRRIAVHAGPGRHYSALRAGVVVANMLACAKYIELVQVSGSNVSDMIRHVGEAEPVEMVKIGYGDCLR